MEKIKTISYGELKRVLRKHSTNNICTVRRGRPTDGTIVTFHEFGDIYEEVKEM